MENQVAGWIISVVVDLLACIIVYIPWIVIQTVEPFHRGFYCDDESIGHPYKDSTVPSAVMIPLGLIVPPAIFIVVEGIITYLRKLQGEGVKKQQIGSMSVPQVVLDCWTVIIVYMFGCALQQSVTNIGKATIGRLRPHFFDICDPDYTKFNCTNSRGLPVYIDSSSVCRTDNLKRLKDARLSFPSGHASFSTYCTVYVAMYLQARFRWRGSKLLRPVCQAALVYMGVLCSLSRISDYKHHWSDVLAGAVLGTGTAMLVALYASGLFPATKRRQLMAQVSEITSLLPTNGNFVNYGSPDQQEKPRSTGPAEIATVYVSNEQTNF